MATIPAALQAGGASPPATVKVWDPFVRVFHWSLVALFAAAFMTGDEVEWLHVRIGYAILGLIALRLLWGIIGPRHARFASFVRGPRAVMAYLRDVALLRAPRYLGHNPAGAAMIVALLVLLLGTGYTGYLMTTGAFWGSKALEEVHEAFANLTIAAVVLHVLGVLVSSLAHRENLMRAMVTGRKRAAD
jgi:cytochrome b